MKSEELIKKLKSPKYGFPYFKALAENGKFFKRDQELNLEKKHSDTFLFKEKITDVFQIEDSPKFEECYEAVTNGEGHESKKISSIRSSSLLGLLAFYKVHLGEKMFLTAAIGNESINFIFTEVFFEKTNRVYNPNRGRSSIDIALRGTANSYPCILYLESKFTEYLEQRDLEKSKKKGDYPISWAYERNHDYSKIFNDISLDIKPEYKEGKGIELKHIRENHYCEGIKQMISHFIGATNSDDLYEGLKVYLGTILFDFSKSNTENSVDKGGALINDYMKQYNILAKKLNSLENKPQNLTVIENAFTYQQLFSKDVGFNLDERVRAYYSL